MNKIAIRTDDPLPKEWWRNLAWTLHVLETWLLEAEPATIRELDRLLLTLGLQSDASLVVHTLGQLRDQMGRDWDGRVVDFTVT